MPSDANIWTPEQLRFQYWLALPKAERQPKQQRLMAGDIGVHESTLSDWKNLPGFRDAVNVIARELVKDDIPDVMAAVRREAKKGSIQHVNIVLAMAGMAADVQAANSPVVKVYAGFDPDHV